MKKVVRRIVSRIVSGMIGKASVTALLFVACSSVLFAGPAKSGQRLTFVYVSHDENMSVYDLVSQLRQIYDDAMNYPESEAAVFYLANGTTPFVASVNMADSDPEAFYSLIEDLQSRKFHDVESETDVAAIIDLFEKYRIVDESGHGIYDRVEWRYYVNSTFWDLHNNENIISALYWTLDMSRLINDRYLKVMIYYSSEDSGFRYDAEHPFGTKNICSGLGALPMPF